MFKRKWEKFWWLILIQFIFTVKVLHVISFESFVRTFTSSSVSFFCTLQFYLIKILRNYFLLAKMTKKCVKSNVKLHAITFTATLKYHTKKKIKYQINGLINKYYGFNHLNFLIKIKWIYSLKATDYKYIFCIFHDFVL